MKTMVPRAVREFWGGWRALPEVAKFTRGTFEHLSDAGLHICNSLNAQLVEAQRRLEAEQQLTENARVALQRATAELASESSARQEAERKLTWLLEWHDQKSEPCQFPRDEYVLWRETTNEVLGETVGMLMDGEQWRPVDLKHYTTESLDAMEKAKSDA